MMSWIILNSFQFKVFWTDSSSVLEKSWDSCIWGESFMLRTFNMHVEMCNTMFGIDTSRTHDRMSLLLISHTLIKSLRWVVLVELVELSYMWNHKFSRSLLCACATNHCDYFQEQKERGGGTVVWFKSAIGFFLFLHLFGDIKWLKWLQIGVVTIPRF